MLENIPETFEFPFFEKPLVSIVIPVYNQYSYTRACLYSILEYTPTSIPYEVVILDDCSTDETQIIKDKIKNITVYRNEINQGFLKNCNTYISKVRGEYVFLLNNDMQVTEGWLEPMVKAFQDPSVAVATSCVLNKNDTIQAAGWTLFTDGIARPNYFGLPADYLIEGKKFDVHYAYGCAFFLRKSLWNKMNGFDELFMPAYCEESDFCMRVRHYLKKRIICVADSKIYHYGNVSYGGNAQELCKLNNIKLYNRWEKQFKEYNIDNTNFNQYLDNLWHWDTIRIFGMPVLKSYYNSNHKTYYLGKLRLFSRRVKVKKKPLKILKQVMKSFDFPVFDKPLVSIVIPVYNQYAYTHACLYSVLKFTPVTIPYEIIILDDCSTDETKDIKDKIRNITVYRNETNQGFLKNCNNNIPKARGKYVFLLNNDTQVTEGWLEPVVKALEESDVGMTTSCVLNADGTIQAAGLTLGKEGTNYANYCELSPQYLREKKMDVQSVYGCAMCFKKDLWNKVGGFDELYLPAYFEEIDFSMKMRYQLKKRIVCPADSKIFHYGMISYVGKGHQLTETNRAKFVERWQKELEKDGVEDENFAQYLDDLWRWDVIRLCGVPVLKSYYKDDKKTYYLGKIKLWSRPFSYDEDEILKTKVGLLDDIPLTFELPTFKNPLVSIVIPVYNQYAYTHACLYSILKFTPENIPYEVVILDDCSTDETQTISERIKNVIIYRNKTNQGFLKNCNNNIPKVRGKYVFLLNNDTEVTEGWLEPMIEVLKEPGVGLTTSCVLCIAGTIQAAGWTLLKDSQSYPNYAGLSPNYLKDKKMDVHYAFGCAMCFEKSLWNKLGGFDEFFLPAYWEESDLCMRIRHKLNKRVVCVGNSKIFHYGKTTYAGKMSDLHKTNGIKFYNRWKEQIQEYNLDGTNLAQYWDDLWRWDTIRLWGVPVLKSYYKDSKKTYYLGKIKLWSRPFSYDEE